MKENKIIHGFEFISEKYLPEIEGTLREAVYRKNGARLLFIDREDANKTFSITFKTIPEDSTGVFHILEHSVLCGSDKYPVKEPFVELLKGSVKTFLNAFTFPDKTMYPVSSRNEKDFYNLISVYMDAVLHPAMLKKPEIFRQEGWHYELCDDELQYKGVVFNEMKGAYSSADELMMEKISSMLYEGSTYGYDSGGDPERITDLSYEQFVAAHRRYYHPSNARIILDGKIDLDKTLALIDSFLCEYEYLDIDTDIPPVVRRGHREMQMEYEISAAEDPSGKARVCMGFYSSRFDERRKIMALALICDAIAGSNEAPFKKAMLDSGICEDAGFIPYDGIQENSLLIEIRNVDESKMRPAAELAIATLKDIVDAGIDKKLLLATFNNMEFKIREQDMATYPAGISYAISALDTWLYGGSAADALAFEDDLSFLRAALDTDYYERLLSEVVLESKHSATLYMIPSPTLGERNAERERERLAKIYAGMSEGERLAVCEEAGRLESWQRSEDTPEALNTLPKLLPTDIESEPEPYPSEEYSIEGVPTLFTKAASRGITYTNLLFDISDFDSEELIFASILCDLYKNLPTADMSAIQMQTQIKSELGSLGVSSIITSRDGKVIPYINVSVSALKTKCGSVVKILSELLLKTLFEDKNTIGKIIKQVRNDDADTIGAAGHSIGLSRSMAYKSRESAVNEYLSGLECYLFRKQLDSEFWDRADELCRRLSALSERIFTRKRLTVCYAGQRDDEFVKSLISVFSLGCDFESGSKIMPLGVRREGLLIPAGIAFAAKAATLGCDGIGGAFAVARSALSFGHLWNTIRVQGGAYGAGFVARRASGNCGFYTYRDPSPARSVKLFSESTDYLRSLAASGEDISSFIIGAVGDSDPLITPKVISALSLASYLRGDTYEARRLYRKQILNTTAADLMAVADALEGAFEDSGVCIVGGRDKLDSCREIIDTVIEI